MEVGVGRFSLHGGRCR